MDLFSLLLLLALVGLVVYLVLQIPMPEPFRTAIMVIALIAVILYLIRVLDIPSIPVGR